MNDVFLLLGSNLGDRKLYLQQAIKHIESAIMPITKQSSVYETQAWGKTDAPNYLNQVVELKTTITAQEVLERILRIEIDMGRKREEKWGSRIIDIDILFFNDAIINEDNLKVPHPELHNRRFTLEPLAELAPYLVHPFFNKNITTLKKELKDSLIVKKL